MKKRGKKIVSLLLAATLTCSTAAGAATAFAAENPDVTYEATYTATAPKGVYTDILVNANQALANAAYTSSTMGSVWGVVFSLSSLSNGTDLSASETYATADPELFGGLAAFMEENNYARVEANVITEYLAAHPELITSAEGFANHVDLFVTFLATMGDNNLQTTLTAVFTLGVLFGLKDVDVQIDNIVRSLGLDPGAGIKSACSGKTLQDYLKTILDGLLPDTTVGIMNVLKTVSVPENQVLLYDNLNGLVTQLLPALDKLAGLGIDLSAIKGPLEQIQNLPTTKIIVEGEAKTVYDINAILDMLVNDVIVPMVAEQLGADVVDAIENVLIDLGLGDLKLMSFGGGNAVLNFDAINMANLANAETPEDTLNVILHYLYTNLNKGTNKLVLLAVNAISGLLPEEAATIINAVATKPEADAVVAIAGVLDKLANRTPVTAISIDQGEAVTVLAGKKLGLYYSASVQLSATIRPNNASNQDITWTSDHSSVKVDANGLVSYRGTLDNPVTANITATANGNTTLSDTIAVTFERAHATGVTLDKAYAEMYEGAAMQLTATVLPANAENKNVTWSSDNEAVATVADGAVTAVAPGTAKITVTTEDGGFTALCVVEVRADKAALNALLDKVADMDLVKDDYDEDAWAVYEAALAAAKDIADDTLATQAAVDQAVADLNAALKALPVAPDLTEVKVVPVSGSDRLEGNVIYHKVPWYRTWMSQTVDLALEYNEGAEIVSVRWEAANWSVQDPEAKIENASNSGATIRPTFGIGARSFWVQAVVTDANGNTVTSNPVKVRFYNWDWQL